MSYNSDERPGVRIALNPRQRMGLSMALMTRKSISIAFRAVASFYALAIIGLSLIPSERHSGTMGSVALEVLFDPWTGVAASLAAASTTPSLLAVLFLLCSSRKHLPLPPALQLLLAFMLAAGAIGLIIAAVEAPLQVLRLVGDLSMDHALAYSSFGLLLALGWGNRFRLSLLGASALLASLALEVLQAPVPGRSVNAWDLLAHACGLAVGLGLGSLLLKHFASYRVLGEFGTRIGRAVPHE